jgi:hypothetical protein
MSNKEINNPIFKKNVTDSTNEKIVKSIYLKKKSKMDREMQTLVWQYYRHRKSLNVNDVIKKYGRESLVINYSIPNKRTIDKVDSESTCTKGSGSSDIDINSSEYMENLQKEIDLVIEHNFDPYNLYF